MVRLMTNVASGGVLCSWKRIRRNSLWFPFHLIVTKLLIWSSVAFTLALMILDGLRDASQHVETPRLKLTRACRACVKAKRKCSFDLPTCCRCWSRKIQCSYENEPGAHSAGGGELSSITSDYFITSSLKRKRPFTSTPAITLRPDEPTFPVIVDLDTLTYMTNLAKRHVFMFGLFGASTFIHGDLKKSQLSRNVQTLSRASTSQVHLTRKQCNVIANDIDYVFNSMLLSAPSIIHVEDMLSLVQNLLLIQIITLHILHGNLDTQHQQRAELRNLILVDWVNNLLHHAPRQLPNSLSRREAFLLAESVRRTIIVSSELRGLYEAKRNGYYEGSLFPQSLPFERRVELWHKENEEEFERAFGQGKAYPKQEMISWREYVEQLDDGIVAENYTCFEMMLLVGAKGKKAVEKQLQRSL